MHPAETTQVLNRAVRERVDSPGVLTRVSKSYYPNKGALNKWHLERESLEVQWSPVLSRDPGSHSAYH